MVSNGGSAQPEHALRDIILIVGDWVVDEYWFLVRHYSQLASHTGFVHYRIASKPEEVVRNLCGAGHVARALHELRRLKGGSYRLVGVGNWHSEDTHLIQHLIHSREDQDCAASKAQFHLQYDFCTHAPDITLIPLQMASPTIRVIRLYHLEKGGFEQINRVDWEPPPSRSASEPSDADLSDLWAQLPQKDMVQSIVVYDLGKGAVTPTLITELAHNLPSARWYVRSKRRNPKWLEEISNQLEPVVSGCFGDHLPQSRH
jgi:hypothetical protein